MVERMQNSLYEISEALSLDVKGEMEDFFSTPRGSLEETIDGGDTYFKMNVKSGAKRKRGRRKASMAPSPNKKLVKGSFNQRSSSVNPVT